MSNSIRYFPCPACGSALSMNNSRMIVSTIREQYAQCTNEHCGGGFVIRAEVVNQLSPPSDLFKPKTQNIPFFTDTQKRAFDLAIEYLGRQWQSQKNRTQRIIACREYLQENLQISNERADVIVRLALADWDAAGLERWGVDKDSSINKTAIVVNEGMTKQHVISLRELVDFIGTREVTKLL